ncbi:hypothetical protein TNCV_3428301 [Trichonephila clavipes]|nr:hypothetical protein TNCV_3428301 [Trichonephila clavipes]
MDTGLSGLSVSYTSQTTAFLEKKAPIMRRKRSHAVRGQQTWGERNARSMRNLRVKKENEKSYERQQWRDLSPATNELGMGVHELTRRKMD